MKRVVRGLVVIGCSLFSAAPMGAQARWTVDAAPVLDIKGVNDKGDVAFGVALGATRLSSGALVVLDGGQPGLKFFDAKGQLSKTVGRAGQGPGEFRYVLWMSQCAKDTLFVWDPPQQRMTVFDAGGTVVTSFRPTGGEVLWLACSRSGAVGYAGTPPREGTVRSVPQGATYAFLSGESKIVLIDTKGAETATLADALGVEMVLPGRGGFPRPLGRPMSFAISATRVFVAATDSTAVHVYGLDGKRLSAIPVRVPPRKPTKAQYEAATDVILLVAPPQVREQARKLLLEIPAPEQLPPFSAIFTDQEGMLWVQLTVPGDADTQFRVLRADGQAVADVRVPINLTIHEIGADYIVGSRQDDDGEQHVVMYRLHRGR